MKYITGTHQNHVEGKFGEKVEEEVCGNHFVVFSLCGQQLERSWVKLKLLQLRLCLHQIVHQEFLCVIFGLRLKQPILEIKVKVR